MHAFYLRALWTMVLMSNLCLFTHTQLPHLPHISEGLMKRNLRRGDMRDMSLGQLQVITNDMHAQIQSEWCPKPTSCLACGDECRRANIAISNRSEWGAGAAAAAERWAACGAGCHAGGHRGPHQVSPSCLSHLTESSYSFTADIVFYTLLIFLLHSKVHLIFVPTGTLTDTRGTRQRKLSRNKTLLVTRVHLHQLSLSWNSTRAHCFWRNESSVRCIINTLAHKNRLHQRMLWKDLDLHILSRQGLDPAEPRSHHFPWLHSQFCTLHSCTLLTAWICTPCFCSFSSHFSQNVIISV